MATSQDLKAEESAPNPAETVSNNPEHELNVEEESTTSTVIDSKQEKAVDSNEEKAAKEESTSTAIKSNQEKMITLQAFDKEIFEVSVSLACQSETIKTLIDDGYADDDSPVPLPNVQSKALAKVIEYWNHHKDDSPSSKDKLKEWDAEFVEMGRDELFDVVLTANYLETKPLLNLLCRAVADNIKDMTVEECREYMGEVNDFTPKEQAEIRRKNSWAFN